MVQDMSSTLHRRSLRPSGSPSWQHTDFTKDPMQLVDELSMIYTTCIMVYAVFSFNQSVLFRQILALGLVSLCAFITAYYHYLQDPTFHQNAYALLTAVVVFRSMYIMEVSIRPSLQKGYVKMDDERTASGASTPSILDAVYENGNGKANGNGLHKVITNDFARSKSNGNGNALHHTTTNSFPHITSNGKGYTKSARPGSIVTAETQAHDLAILNRMWLIVSSGLVIFLGGFLLWNLDNSYCSRIRTWRNSVGLPWGILLEGHGWWHLMTGTGAYMSLVWGIWLRECLKGNKAGVACQWLGDAPLDGDKATVGGWRWLPELVRVERDEETGEVRELKRNAHLKVQ